jgi:type I restriction enzyme S subunit
LKAGELNDKFLLDSNERISQTALSEGKARVFPAGTIFIALYGATIGKLAIASHECSSNQAALGMVPNGTTMGRWQLFHALFRLRDWFFSIGQGAAQQNISKEKVATAPVVVPPKEISQLFDRLVSPFWEMRGNLERQQQKLAAARDLLLPRLISGQLSVEAAAPMLAAAE